MPKATEHCENFITCKDGHCSVTAVYAIINLSAVITNYDYNQGLCNQHKDNDYGPYALCAPSANALISKYGE